MSHLRVRHLNRWDCVPSALRCTIPLPLSGNYAPKPLKFFSKSHSKFECANCTLFFFKREWASVSFCSHIQDSYWYSCMSAPTGTAACTFPEEAFCRAERKKSVDRVGANSKPKNNWSWMHVF